MPDVFVNFRTGDEESAATLIERDLSARFGPERIFRDSRSIRAGDQFAQRILSAVHGSQVLLAVIGPRWLDARGRERLEDTKDWVRRELLEAREYGVRVIPVLVGTMTRLDGVDLPEALSWLADLQYRSFSDRHAEADLATIAADIVDFVPGLEDRTKTDTSPPAAVDNTARDVQGNMINIVGNHGNVHAGEGHQFNAPTNYFAGRGDTL